MIKGTKKEHLPAKSKKLSDSNSSTQTSHYKHVLACIRTEINSRFQNKVAFSHCHTSEHNTYWIRREF